MTVDQVLRARTDAAPGSLAVLALGRTPLTYARLQAQVERVARTLGEAGVGPADRVSVCLPDGPDMAVACIAVAAGAVSAPLCPAFPEAELDTYVELVRPQAIVLPAGTDGPARQVAERRGLRVFELAPAAEAGAFDLTSPSGRRGVPHRPVGPLAHLAFVLVTSGTTARPKVVPLTHANVCTAARDMAVALGLRPEDRLLSVMPLFHSHGLVSTVFASLVAGASVVCTPGFSPPAFFEWLACYQPTWYSAVPTIHQAVLDHAALHPDRAPRHQLRLVRSSSSALAPRVLADLERLFGAPVIEAYGTTEVSSITCNPLPPRPRKLGSVGVSTGPEVVILDAASVPLSAGATGAIAVRGPSVIASYDSATPASDAFASGWFRTGDLGYLDEDGYLFITGRVGETINRGGAKVAPREVDEVFLEHPAVAKACTVPVPHPRWGEDVVTAVVLRPSAMATESELRRFAATRLAPFKVPTRVYRVDALPVGHTGKPHRGRVVEQLRETGWLASDRERVAPVETGSPLEALLGQLMTSVLGLEIGRHDNFFQRGGDSLLATQFLVRMREAIDVDISVPRFFEHPSVAELAVLILAEAAGHLDPDAPGRPGHGSAAHGQKG